MGVRLLTFGGILSIFGGRIIIYIPNPSYFVSGQPASSADTVGSDVTSSPAGISSPEELSVEGTRDDWIVPLPPPPPYHALCSIKEKVY